MTLISRRAFAKFSMTAPVSVAAAPAGFLLVAGAAPGAADDKLQSELLFDLVLEPKTPSDVGSPGVNRFIVEVAEGTFEGPKLRGTIVGPSGDWIVQRPDGSSVLDVRLLLQTDDAQKIYVSWRGINYTPRGGTQYARIVPLFETGSKKYDWLNHVVSVGVHRPTPGKVAYRVYQIL